MDTTVMLPAPMKDVAPDATQALQLLASQGRLFDVKWDGVRAVLDIGAGTLTNRTGRDISYRYPEVLAAVRDLPAARLDGELVCLDGDALPQFTMIARRDALESPRSIRAASRATPAVFVAFDLLALGEDDRAGDPLDARLDALRTYLASTATQHLVPSVASREASAMWQAVRRLGLEGLIAKDPSSPWKPGRSSSWVKVKKSCSVSAVARAYEPGRNGLVGGLGALRLELLSGDKWVEVGHVGTGFSQRDRADLQRLLDSGRELVVDVEFLELTENGVLRFPTFRGVRDDLSADACTYDQLATS